MTTLFLLNSIVFKTETEPGTKERADEIINHLGIILDCQKPYWKARILDLFIQFIKDDTLDPIKLAEDKENGLFWPFHKLIFGNMCLAFISD